MAKFTKSPSFSARPALSHLTRAASHSSNIKLRGCTHVVSSHDICACAMKAATNLGVVCIGNPSIPGPSPDEWVRNHRQTRSLTLSSPDFATRTTFKDDVTVVSTLHALHVKHPFYLDLKSADKPSHHWLHEMAERNPALETLTLYGPGAPGVRGLPGPAQTQIVPFKISNFFGRVLPSMKSLTLRHFVLSDTELDKLFTFFPLLMRLQLEHVTIVTECPTKLLPYNSLREIVLLKTTPTRRLIQVLAGVEMLVLKGDINSPVSALHQNTTRWEIRRDIFDRLVLGMPLLETVKIDRVDFVPKDREIPRIVTHCEVTRVCKSAAMDLEDYFPNAVVETYWM
ncbi:hypothetical protein BGZ74_003181 [Mortierella antarctica]|nr:hypothetical protein BGZ74_003181 [Mortierella antarctica]